MVAPAGRGSVYIPPGAALGSSSGYVPGPTLGGAASERGWGYLGLKGHAWLCMHDIVQVEGPTHCMSCLHGHRELLPGTPYPCALGRMLVLPKREKAVQDRWHRMKRLQRPHPGSRPQPPLPPASSPPAGQALLKAGLDGDGVGAWHQWGLLVVRLLFLQGLWQQCSRGPGAALQ